jgi:hypothetical protein
MTNKYGILQSSGMSCVFYKEDEDGNQSTFNLFVSSDKDTEGKKLLTAFIDNEQMGKNNWFSHKNLEIDDAIKAFREWASDAPVVFEMEAHNSLSNCLTSIMKKED